MPSNLRTNISAEIAGDAVYDVQPPAGEAWVIYEVSSEEAFNNEIPDLDYGIADGDLTLSLIVIDPNTAAQKGDRAKEIYVDNAHYLTITNRAAAAAFIGWTGELVNPDIVITDLVTCPTAGLGYVDIRPPAGETWRITEIGTELNNGGLNHPEVTIGITDGTLVASVIMEERCDRAQYKALDWYIDNDLYLRVTNSAAAADVDFAFCGVRVPETSIGSIQDVVGSAVLDIRPPVGEEWVITEIAAEQWTGVPGQNDLPNIVVSLYDGTNLSDLLESAAVSLAWNRRFKIHIDRDTYLRITEISTNPNEVGVLGYRKRSFS